MKYNQTVITRSILLIRVRLGTDIRG